MTTIADPTVGARPLSVAQEALWYHSLLKPSHLAYNETISIRKDGPLDVQVLRDAFTEIVRRHDAWRTTFDTVGAEPVRVLHPAAPFDLPVLDLSRLTPEQAERQAVRAVAQISRIPYDVRRGPLVRPRLIRFPGEHHRLYLALHHLVFDGVSLSRVIVPELIELYDAFTAGRPSPLAEGHDSYGDYARWEQDWITKPRTVRRLDYWRQRLTPLPTCSLPLDHPRPASARGQGGAVPVSVRREAMEQLSGLARDIGCTLFQLLAAVWAVLLSRYCGQRDVAFATAADLRQRSEFEPIVGYCLTPLVLRVDVDTELTFAEFALRLRNELLDALDHVLPFERVVRELPGTGASNANPVFQTLLVMEPATAHTDPDWSLHLVDSALADAAGNAKVDVELQLDHRPDGHMAGRLIYDRDLFEPATAARLATHWLRLLDGVLADPSSTISSLAILTPTEEERQLVEWNATATQWPTGVLHQLIGSRAAERPDAPALSTNEGTISYGELDRRAERHARRQPGQPVAIYAESYIDAVVDALGALKAGVPVGLSHAAMVNRVSAMATELGIGPADTVLALPSKLFAFPLVDLWVPLATGARIVVAAPEDAADGKRLSKLIAREGISVLHATPSNWQALIDTGLKPSRSLRAVSGGGVLSPELADQILKRTRVLWNAYGDAETGGYCTLARVERSSSVTIGRPIANMRAYVLDDHDQPVPVGVTGHLLLAGPGIDAAEIGIEEPRGPGHAYRTGDLVRWLPSGELELVRLGER